MHSLHGYKVTYFSAHLHAHFIANINIRCRWVFTKYFMPYLNECSNMNQLITIVNLFLFSIATSGWGISYFCMDHAEFNRLFFSLFA